MPEEHSDDGHRNEVLLVGRLAAEPETRELPSGALITTFRLVVRRDPKPADRSRPAESRAPTVDTVDCVAWRADVRRHSAGWLPGDVLRCEGALRRRFWRSPGGPASRTEVEAVKVRRLSKASARAAG
jgi:single-strand DNA-binding protein